MSQVCGDLHRLINSLPVYEFPFRTSDIPRNGIYVLFESGELAHGTNRIVRVGTHTGEHQLPSRLEQHFVRENKDRSIFRKHIGRALLHRNNDPFIAQWDIDLTTRKAKDRWAGSIDHGRIRQVEVAVTAYIRGHFRFAAFPVEDRDRRLNWEAKIISTVAQCRECQASEYWLGRDSPVEGVRRSGLWLVQHLSEQPLSQEEYCALGMSVLSPASRSR